MLHRNRPIALPASAIWLMLATVLASSIPTAEARRRKRRHRKKAVVTAPQRAARELTQVGSPKVVVVRRAGVRAFRLASVAFRKDLSFPAGEVVLDPATPPAEQQEDIVDAKPKILLALGPGAASLLAKGGVGVPVVFGYVSSRPVTTVRQGGWLSQATASRRVLRWVLRLVGRARSRRVAVVVRDGKGSLARDFRAACGQLGIQPVVIVAPVATDVVRRVAAALKRRPGAVWLGHHVGLYPPAVLRQLRRIQAQFRLPMVGLTRQHVKDGLVLAVDATPAQLARAAQRLIRRRVGKWTLGVQPRKTDKGRAQASRLFREVVVADRITLNTRAASGLGLDPRAALKAGAQKVGAQKVKP